MQELGLKQTHDVQGNSRSDRSGRFGLASNSGFVANRFLYSRFCSANLKRKDNYIREVEEGILFRCQPVVCFLNDGEPSTYEPHNCTQHDKVPHLHALDKPDGGQNPLDGQEMVAECYTNLVGTSLCLPMKITAWLFTFHLLAALQTIGTTDRK